MKKKRILFISFVVILTVAFLLGLLYTRPRPLMDILELDESANSGFVIAATWYPFTENDRQSQFNIDRSEMGSPEFEELRSLLGSVTVRASLTPWRWPDTVVGEPSTTLTYSLGGTDYGLIFNDRFLLAGYAGQNDYRLWKVDPEVSRALSDYITAHGYNMQEYLESMK